MTINKLVDCKTIAEFNEFSKNVETDMNSAGRSFIYTGPNGKQRSYTMNQIVRQFEKCINNGLSEGSKTKLSADVNQGLEYIDQWNQAADARENTSMLGVRKWLGNWWYSITHSGFNKDETLAKIKSTYTTTLKNLPSDMLNSIMTQFLRDDEQALASLSMVSKTFNTEVMKIEEKNDALIAKYGIFGRKQWQEYGVTIGNVPALPEGIEKIMDSGCPIWPDKKVSETHRLVLMPKTVNGKPLTLNNFGKIARKNAFLDRNPVYRFISDGIAQDMGNTPIDQSYWMLMTKEPIPESGSKSYADQQTMLTDLAVKSKSDYEAPRALEACVFALTQYFQDGMRLFENNVTRCQEVHYGEQVCVGGFSAGLCVYGSHYYADVRIGVAARRMF